MKILLLSLFVITIGCTSVSQSPPTEKKPIIVSITTSKNNVLDEIIHILTDDRFSISEANDKLGIVTTDYQRLKDSEKVDNWLLDGIVVNGKLSVYVTEKGINLSELKITPIIKYKEVFGEEDNIIQVGEGSPFYKKYLLISNDLKIKYQ